MAFDNRPQLVELNRAGFAARAEQLDRAKSVIGLSYILASGATPATVTGTVAETTLLSIVVPGGLMGPNGALRVYTLWSMTGSTNSKIFRQKLGGYDFFSGRNITAAATVAMAAQRVIQARGSEVAQVCYTGWADLGSNSAINGVSAVDTTIDQPLILTAQLGLSTESVTLESWLIEAIAT